MAQLLRTSEEAEALIAYAEAEVDALFARRLGQKLFLGSISRKKTVRICWTLPEPSGTHLLPPFLVDSGFPDKVASSAPSKKGNSTPKP